MSQGGAEESKFMLPAGRPPLYKMQYSLSTREGQTSLCEIAFMELEAFLVVTAKTGHRHVHSTTLNSTRCPHYSPLQKISRPFDLRPGTTCWHVDAEEKFYPSTTCL